jgi:hypothetical protein
MPRRLRRHLRPRWRFHSVEVGTERQLEAAARTMEPLRRSEAPSLQGPSCMRSVLPVASLYRVDELLGVVPDAVFEDDLDILNI